MKHLIITLSVFLMALSAGAEGVIVNTMNLQQLRGTAYFHDKELPEAVAEYKYLIEFPTMLQGYDVTTLTAAVAEWLNMPKGSGPEGWMEVWSTLPVDDTFEPCAKHLPTCPGPYVFGVPDMTIELKVDWFLQQEGVIQIECFYASDYRSGLGASYTPFNEYFIFNLNTGKRVELSDLFEGSYSDKLMTAMLNGLEYTAQDQCIFMDQLKEVGLSKYWMIPEPNSNTIAFVYPKYEVACGAAGAPKIEVYIPVGLKLTPLGEKLLKYQWPFE